MKHDDDDCEEDHHALSIWWNGGPTDGRGRDGYQGVTGRGWRAQVHEAVYGSNMREYYHILGLPSSQADQAEVELPIQEQEPEFKAWETAALLDAVNQTLNRAGRDPALPPILGNPDPSEGS